ncbi:MAG: hypothetical protein QM802_13100 [Agriterribacter sp.]
MLAKKINTINVNIGKSPLLYAAIFLSIPFIIVFIYTHGLRSGIDPVFSVDEGKFHYPTILQFANQLPFPDVRDYNSATTPLFHILLAIASKVTGTELTHLRMVNFLITYATVILFFKIIIEQFKISFLSALLFTLLFALSPYFFREAFVVLTDNLPVLWLILFFQVYLKYKQTQHLRFFLWSLFFIMLLCLTRQTYLYVWLALVIDLAIGNTALKNKAGYIALSFVAIIPTLALFYVWKGLTPPSFIAVHTRTSLLNIKAVVYGFSVLGFYGLFITGANVYSPFFKSHRVKIVLAVLAAWVLIYFSPLIKAREDFGFLWYMASSLPKVAGTSLFFYIFSALGAIIFLSAWQKEGLSFYLLFIMGLFLSEVPNKFIFQRYYDSSILIFLLFLTAKYHVSNKFKYSRLGALIVFFIAYFVVYTLA